MWQCWLPRLRLLSFFSLSSSPSPTVSLHPAVHISVCLLHGVWSQKETGKIFCFFSFFCLIAFWGVAGSMLGWIPELGSVWNISPEFEVRTGQIIGDFAPFLFTLSWPAAQSSDTLHYFPRALHCTFTNKQFIQNVLRLEVCVCSLVRLITVLWAIFHVKSCWRIAFPALNQGVALLFIPAVSSLLAWCIPWAGHVQK